MLLTVGLLGLGMGCKGKSHDAGTNISGTVSYTRIPLHVGADGVPTGLETDPSLFVTLPARGVQIRIFQAIGQVDPYGNPYTAWLQSGTATTDINGTYSLSGFATGYLTCVELDSVAPGNNPIRIVADPAGIGSSVPEPSRVIYTQRLGADGVTTATGATPPGTVLGGDSIVNFNVGLNDAWQVMRYNWNSPTTGPYPTPATSTAGSAVLAILDSIYTFTYNY